MTSVHVTKLSIQAGYLLLSLILSVLAATLSMRNPSRFFRRALVFAITALLIGVMGVWAPVSFWPRMGFAWTFANGLHIAFDFRWCFLLPLVLAVGACILVVLRRPGGQPA